MSDRPGWILATVAIGYDPNDHSGANFYAWTSRGFGVIVRLNNGYGSTGTIPTVEHYEQFAARCANFVGASPGVDRVIIGNEPNHENERPNGVYITPEQYARCFTICRNAIKGVSVNIQVMPAPVAPYHADGMDCMEYWRKLLERIKANGGCDGIPLHAYTRSSNPVDITSTATMGPPLEGQYSGFLTYQNQADIAAGLGFGGLPAYITEFNELLDQGWDDANTGVVQAAYREINEWNLGGEKPQIHALCLYRSNRDDKWSFADKNGVKEDFRQAVAVGYTVASTPQPQPPEPTPPTPEPARDIDPHLLARGVKFDFVKVPAGTLYWRITYAEHLDEQEADGVGPDHHILGEIIKNGVQTAGVPVGIQWPSGSTTVVSKADDPNATYNYDYPMSKSLNEYSIQIADGAPTDSASGIGMGANGNPAIHTSTWITWELTLSSGHAPPIVPPATEIESARVTARDGLNLRRGPGTEFAVLGTLGYGSTVLHDDEQQGWLHVVDGWVSAEYVGEPAGAETTQAPPITPGGLVHPLPGSVITQHFYQHAENYEQWGLVGHDGTDLGGVGSGTPVYCVAAGVVKVATFDKDYGNYLFVQHDQLGCTTMYCHASELLVGPGAHVSAGQTIMKVGTTGNSSGPHLHFEVRLINPDGSYKQNTPQVRGRVDPQTWCALYGLEL
jgi:murein DD-endopeptidase MepM/ murein hydrolase activator NlpD